MTSIKHIQTQARERYNARCNQLRIGVNRKSHRVNGTRYEMITLERIHHDENGEETDPMLASSWKEEISIANENADGGIAWESNGNVLDWRILADYGVIATEANVAAYDTHLKAVLNDYRQSQLNLSDEVKAEQAAERRAAFGPGETIVNIITGETYIS